MNVGEEKDLNVTFPENYAGDLGGKAVVFHVKLNKLTVSVAPVQDDEFAKDVSEFETLEELKNDIRTKALEAAQKQADSAFEQPCVEKAAEKQAKITVTLEKIAEVENLEVSEEDLTAEFEAMAKQYDLTVEKIKEMVPVEEIKASLKTRKAVKVITESAVAVAPKAE